MKYKIIIVVLALVIVVGGVYFEFRLFTLTERFNELAFNYTNLQTSFNNLEYEYTQLETAHNSLQVNYDSLGSDYESLESDYYLLEEDFQSLKTDYNKLLAENRDLEELVYLYESVPHSYYSVDAFPQQPNTWEALNEFLLYELRLPVRYYRENEFDCSEASAYIEWALEDAGFDADIVVGPSPWNPTGGYHAWNMVYCEGERAAIEATWLTGKHYFGFVWWERIPGVIYLEDDKIDCWEGYYYGYDKIHENIYFTLRDYRATLEWDWWVEFWEF